MKKRIFAYMAIVVALVSCKPEQIKYHTAADVQFEMTASEAERGVPIQFTDKSVAAKGSTLVGWEWNFNFEDKKQTTELSTERNPVYAFPKVGTFTVRLVVTDSNGQQSSASKTIKIVTPYKELAHADFDLPGAKVMMNEELSFTDKSIPAEGATLSKWEWNFGVDKTSISDMQNPKWTYTTSGSYTVSLKVTDSKGNTSSVSKDILVMDPSDLVTIEWKSAMLGAIENTMSPAMSPDGKTVYMYADQSADNAYDVVVKAYDTASGTEKWAFNVNNALAELNANGGVRLVYSSPSVGNNGDIYVCARDLKNSGAARKSFMFAIKPDGTKHWHYAFGIDGNFNYMTQAIDAAGNIYVGHLTTKPFEIAVINPATGAKDKSISLEVGVRSGISLSKNGDIYFCSTGTNGMLAYNNAGTQSWAYNNNVKTTGGAISIDEKGVVYTVVAGASSGILCAVNANGSEKWQYALPGDTPYGGAVLGSDGTVYTNGGTGLVAVNGDGTLKWQFDVDEPVQNCVPLVDDRGYIHFVTDKATYYVVTNDGKLYGKKSIGTKTFASPVMGTDGKVYIAAQEEDKSFMFCLGTGATGYADSAWPMKGQNPQRTHLQK